MIQKLACQLSSVAIVVPSGTPITEAILNPAPTQAITMGRRFGGVMMLTSKLTREMIVPATKAVITRAISNQVNDGANAVNVFPTRKTTISPISKRYRFQLLVSMVTSGVLIAYTRAKAVTKKPTVEREAW